MVMCRFNKYSQISARALRNSLKEEPRLAAEKRGISELRYQNWKDGKAGEQVRFRDPSMGFDEIRVMSS